MIVCLVAYLDHAALCLCRNLLFELLGQVTELTEQQVRALLSMEQTNVWTQDHYSFSTAKASFRAMLDAQVTELRAKNALHINSTDEDLLDKIAGTLAYFQVSSRRVCDGVPMHIRYHLVQGFSNVLRQLPICVTASSSTDPSTASDSDGEAVQSMPQQIAGIVASGGLQRTSGCGVQRLQLAKSAEELLTELESASQQREQLTAMQQQLRKGVQILQAF